MLLWFEVYINIHKEIKKLLQKLEIFVFFPSKCFFLDEYIFSIMIFAKYDIKPIFKDIQRMELGETVEFLKILQKIANFCVFSKKNRFSTLFYKICGTDVKQTYC